MALLAAMLGLRPARAEPLAVTVDDLPVLSLSDSPRHARAVTHRLVGRLRSCGIPATGFVVGEKFSRRPGVAAGLLRTWRSAGLQLGNHTYSHLSLNEVSAARYIADIAREDGLLRRPGLEGAKAELWFRHPYLETGPTADARATVETWLSSHRYRVAPVTLENDDDIFATPYEDALRRHQTGEARRIRAAYLTFTEARIAWYREAAVELLGRRPALVMLIHATALNADSLPAVCRLLHAEGLRPVPLAEALRDPAYGLPEGPPTTDGDDWLNRWAVVLGRDLPWDSFPEAPEAIKAASERLDPER